MTASNTTANSILQFTAQDRVRGRASSLYMLAMRGGLSLGNLIMGASVTYLGVRNAFLINGILAIVIEAWIYRRWAVAIANLTKKRQPSGSGDSTFRSEGSMHADERKKAKAVGETHSSVTLLPGSDGAIDRLK